MGKITRNELSPVLTAELDGASAKQDEILAGVQTVKTNVESVKTDTQNILAKFPISGGVDWSNKTPKYAIGRITGASLATVLEISGQGYLISITQILENATAYTGYLQLIVDGETVISDADVFSGFSGYVGMLNSIIRFNNSLVIKHRTGSASGVIVNTRAYYLLD